MHLQRRIKIQFAVFTVIAVVAMAVLAFGYGRVGSALFGLERYTVTVNLAESGGLYSRANVTYQGSTVGRVTDVSATANGVRAVLSMSAEVAIPSELTAEVHSQSAIGEQFVALVPRDPDSRPLRNGDVIAVDNTTVPPDIGDQLDMTAVALQAIPQDSLRTVVDESYRAVGGLGPDLARLLDGSINLAIDTRAQLDHLTNVIDNSGPILASQANTDDEVSAWASHMATISEQLSDNNAPASRLLANAAPAADEARALFERLNPSVPILLANIVGIADVGVVYNPNIEQMLVLVPQVMAQLGASAVTNMNNNTDYRGTTQQAVLNLNVPPVCATGYLPPQQRRTAAEVDFPERPEGDFYCRVPQDSSNVVRGARNIPCAGKPWKRAPLVWMCESDIDYVPLNDGYNWKGDPNATLTGQDVPQLPPGHVAPPAQDPAGTSLPVQMPASPDGRPPESTPPGALGVADYNPVDGTYLGPDGEIYTQSNLAAGGATPTLQSMLLPPAPAN